MFTSMSLRSLLNNAEWAPVVCIPSYLPMRKFRDCETKSHSRLGSFFVCILCDCVRAKFTQWKKRPAKFVTFAFVQEIGGVTRPVLTVDERCATKFSQQFMLSNGLCRPCRSVDGVYRRNLFVATTSHGNLWLETRT